MNKQQLELLNNEVKSINRYLFGFDSQKTPEADLFSNKTLVIKNLPLPDKYNPDSIDVAFIVEDFPISLTVGMYVMTTPQNNSVIKHLQKTFNTFQDQGFHGAPSIEGFTWICVGYLEGWHYNIRAPHKGDNIVKLLEYFWNEVSK